jgi:hypothetical protein
VSSVLEKITAPTSKESSAEINDAVGGVPLLRNDTEIRTEALLFEIEQDRQS